MLANALDGVRVLDFTHVGAGPTCTMLLGDMGATVIKVEPLSGDMARSLGPPWKDGESAWFMSLNRNKRSVAIDLKHPDSQQILTDLLRTVDVVVESYRPGVAERLGFGYGAASLLNSSIIYCSISAYGQKGPWSERPGVDGILQATSGLMSVLGHPGGEPCKMPIPIVDMSTGYLASNAILASIVKRGSTPQSVHLDVSMFNCAIMLQQTAYAAWGMSGDLPKKNGSAAPYAAPNEAYPTKDGWIMIAAYQPAHWKLLCESIGAPLLEKDPRFSSLPLRVKNRTHLKAVIAQQLAMKPSLEWVTLLSDAGIMCAEVADYAQVAKSAPYVHGELNETISHPTAGDIRMPRFGLEEPGGPGKFPPPVLGQHTREILSELGLSESSIDSLLNSGAVACQP